MVVVEAISEGRGERDRKNRPGRSLSGLLGLLSGRQHRAEDSSVPYQSLNTNKIKCFHNHQLGCRITGGSTMSVVGCFGDCGFGSTQPSQAAKRPREYKLVFHPPIQTILREKDDTKWYTDMVNELATLGDDPNTLTEFGEAPLCVAAYKGSGMIVEEMLKQPNIRVNIKGKHGRTALYLAAEGGYVYVVKLLLQHPDIDVNSRNGPGRATALMIASRRGHSRVVEILLQHPRCEVEAGDKDGCTAAHHARSQSVKWKLHNHGHRSRSMETVLCTDSRTPRPEAGNLCRVSPLEPDSWPGTPETEPAGRRLSLGPPGAVGPRRGSGGSSSGHSTRLSSGSKDGGGSSEGLAPGHGPPWARDLSGSLPTALASSPAPLAPLASPLAGPGPLLPLARGLAGRPRVHSTPESTGPP